jgi:dipeptidyl aminopeptidase/acylaminoacyl peptidase
MKCATHFFALALLSVFNVYPTHTQEAPRPMTIVDIINVPSIGDLQISPDGNQLLYVRTDADWEENETRSHIWRVNSDGTGSVQMTIGERSESSPRWSPDGSTIAFLTERGEEEYTQEEEHTQIYLIPNDGGEGRALTEHPTPPSGIQWSPDGSWIYFTAREDLTEAERAREEVNDNVFRYEEDQKNSHLWRVNVESGETVSVTEGDFSLRGYNISRDGSMIVFHRAPSPLYDDQLNSEVWIMNSDGTEARQLTTNTVGESGARLSPDNSTVLFSADANEAMDDYYYNERLFFMRTSGGRPELVLSGSTYDVGGAIWSEDGRSIYFTANTGIRQNIYQVYLDDSQVLPFVEGDFSIRGWAHAPNARVFAFTASSPTTPGDIQLQAVSRNGRADGDSRQVTHLFDHLAEDFQLPRVESLQWRGEDGVTVEGLLYYPLDYQAGTRYPLVVQTHGGPASSDKFSFHSSSRYEPVLTAMGYFVFKPNYRGSTGYGDDFLRDMVGNYFNQAHKDVMAGVDHLIDRGLVDGDRMAKMGWSAGGHMTNKIITYTDRFKAASSGAGAINWISMYAQSDVRIYRTPWFGGTPWEENSPIEQYMADSPLFDVHRVTTPTLVLVGENDNRVPMPQSVELYRALKHNGVPTHLYVAPDQGHGWRELQQRLFKANVELDWFERWVMDREYDWERSSVHPDGPEDIN